MKDEEMMFRKAIPKERNTWARLTELSYFLLTTAVESSRNVEIVILQRLLSLGADLSLTDGNCNVRAIEVYDEHALRGFFDAGVDVNARIGSGRGTFPLHRALSVQASDRMVQTILASGAELN